MNAPGSVREALMAEVIGDLGRLITKVEALQPAIAESRQTLIEANAQLGDRLAAFEAQMAALTEKAKIQVVKHIVARADDAARRSIELQSRAMADAARVAFGTELGASLQQLRWSIQPLIDRREHPWERWLIHAATVAAAAAVTWALALFLLAK